MEENGRRSHNRQGEEKEEIPRAHRNQPSARKKGINAVRVSPADGIHGGKPRVGQERSRDEEKQDATKRPPTRGEKLALHDSEVIMVGD